MTVPFFETPDQSLAVFASLGYRESWKPAPEPFTAVTTIRDAGKICDVTEGLPERLSCATVESNFLGTLGVRPTLGRDFTPEDDTRGAPPVAIISHDVWTRRFGADPGAIGRTINLNGKAIPVIGILPAGFAMPAGDADILQPQQLFPLDPKSSSIALFTAFGRLKPGITPEQAEAAIAPIMKANFEGLPGITDDSQTQVVPLRKYLVGDASLAAWLLLIACVNVANLILARLSARNHEFAVAAVLTLAAGLYGVASYLVTQRTRDIGVRMALGAAPGDISRQVMSEAGRWIVAGAILGCALAWAGTRVIEAQLYGVGSRDPLSWIMALGVMCAALLLPVLHPAARAARVDPMEALRVE